MFKQDDVRFFFFSLFFACKMFCWKNTFVCIVRVCVCTLHFWTASRLFVASFAFLTLVAPKMNTHKKKLPSNCIDQHQPLFLLFIFDFHRFSFCSCSKSFYCRWWKTYPKIRLSLMLSYKPDPKRGFYIKNLSHELSNLIHRQGLYLRWWNGHNEGAFSLLSAYAQF